MYIYQSQYLQVDILLYVICTLFYAISQFSVLRLFSWDKIVLQSSRSIVSCLCFFPKCVLKKYFDLFSLHTLNRYSKCAKLVKKSFYFEVSFKVLFKCVAMSMIQTHFFLQGSYISLLSLYPSVVTISCGEFITHLSASQSVSSLLGGDRGGRRGSSVIADQNLAKLGYRS